MSPFLFYRGFIMASYSVVGASASPLFTSKPNLIRSAILRATINGWPKTPTILDAIVSGYNVDFHRAYNYANNGYYRGHLQASNEAATINWDNIRQWLADYWGVTFAQVIMTYTEFDALSGTSDRTRNCDISRDFDIYGISIDPATGYYTGFSGMPVGYVAEITSIDEQRIDGDEFDPSELYWQVNFTWFDPDDRENTEEPGQMYRISSYMNEGQNDCVQVTYTIPGSVTLYLCYDPEDTYFPELSRAILADIESDYFPVALLRIGSQDTAPEWIGERANLSIEENEKQLKDTKRMLEYWGLNYNSLKDELSTNPDIDDITRAFVTLAVPISSLQDIDKETSEYLYKYLQYVIDTYTPPTKQEWIDADSTVLFGRTQSIRFYEEVPSTLRMTIMWDYIDKESITYDAAKPSYSFGKTINYTENYDASDFPGSGFTGDPSKIFVEFHDSTDNTAYRITVSNLQNTLVDNVLDPDNTPLFTLRQAFPESDEDTVTGIIFPMSVEVLNNMSKKSATSAAMTGIVLITQTFLQIKLKWYERQDFWDAIKLIIFVVSVITMSPQIAAAAQQGLTELAMYILEAVIVGALIGEAVGYITTFLVDIIGAEAALLLAVIATAASAYYGFSDQTFAYLPTAEDMLKIVTLMAQEINEITKEEFIELEEEYSEFLSEYNEAMEQIEDAEDGLLTVGVDPAWIVRNTGFSPNETPDSFYTRTVGTPNPGIYSLDALTDFYDNQLKLPSVGSSGLTL